MRQSGVPSSTKGVRQRAAALALRTWPASYAEPAEKQSKKGLAASRHARGMTGKYDGSLRSPDDVDDAILSHPFPSATPRGAAHAELAARCVGLNSGGTCVHGRAGRVRAEISAKSVQQGVG